MKKVAMLTSVHYCFDTRIFHKQARTLQEAGYDVTLIAQHDADETVDGIRIKAVQRPAGRLGRMLFTTWRVLKRALDTGAQVYHLHDPELVFAGLMLKLLGRKVIYDAHEDYEKSLRHRDYLPKFARVPVARTVGIIERYLTRPFDAVVTATDEIGKNFKWHKRVRTIRNFPFIMDSCAERDGGSGFVTTFAYLGYLHAINGITEMVKAMEHVDAASGIKLVLAGQWRPEGYKNEVQALKGFERVECAGWIDYRDVPAFLGRADVGMMVCRSTPNNLHALPNKMFEYMSAGLPVIASDFPLWKKYVEEEGAGLCVDAGDPRAITRAMEYLHRNPEIRRGMGENGRRAVKEKYNWDKESRRLLELYKEVLA